MLLLSCSPYLSARLDGYKTARPSSDESPKTSTTIEQTQQAAATDCLCVRARVFEIPLSDLFI